MFESYFLVLMLTAAVLAGRRVLARPGDRHRAHPAPAELPLVGGDGDRSSSGAVLAGILLFWPQGLVGLWRFARRAMVTRGHGVAIG